MKIRLLIAFAAVIFGALTIAGQMPGNPPRFCRNGFFPHDTANFRIARISKDAALRNYFRDDADEACPRGPKCKTSRYIVRGDEVIASRDFDGFTCVWYDARGTGETVGWIETKALEFDASSESAKVSDWIGTWSFYDNEIRVKALDGGRLHFLGEAFWRGSATNIHTGEIDYEADMAGREAAFGEDPKDEFGCRVTSRLVGRFMIVADNMNCGGANVSFSGVYRRTKPKTK